MSVATHRTLREQALDPTHVNCKVARKLLSAQGYHLLLLLEMLEDLQPRSSSSSSSSSSDPSPPRRPPA